MRISETRKNQKQGRAMVDLVHYSYPETRYCASWTNIGGYEHVPGAGLPSLEAKVNQQRDEWDWELIMLAPHSGAAPSTFKWFATFAQQPNPQ
ncbi:MAG: hypothetical protein M1833_001277 [Piccolia ochrophora]|nr:MAG: hypothetical protein M1833_001277 [Piccolia ochrophora]